LIRFTYRLLFEMFLYTVLRMIKLKKIPVPVRFRSGFSKLEFRRYFTIFLRYLRTLCIDWSLVKRRVAMRNVLKYRKLFQNG